MILGFNECPHKTILAEDIHTAIRAILEIHNLEVERVLTGDFVTDGDTEQHLRVAREKKALAIDRYREHVTSHGC